MPQARLSEQQAIQMIKLQQLFHNRYMTAQFLHQLTSIYVKAIQTFSGQFSFMRVYFMDKLQFLLSCAEIVHLLEGNSMADSIRETIRMTQRPIQIPNKSSPFKKEQQKKIQIKKEKINEKQKPLKQIHHEKHQYFHHTHDQHHYHHYDQKKNNQNNSKLDMKMKLMREVQENIKNIHQQVDQADRKLQQKQEKIKDITKNQQKLFNQRLAKRKNKRRKSVENKKKIPGNQQQEVQPEPVVLKQELKQAQRQLTYALYKFTIRMTQRQKQNQIKQQNRKDGMKKLKKARNIEEDDILLQEQEQNEQHSPELKKKQKIQPIIQKNPQIPQVRAKTKRRNLDSDDDDDD